jgi:hypothetical protein
VLAALGKNWLACPEQPSLSYALVTLRDRPLGSHRRPGWTPPGGFATGTSIGDRKLPGGRRGLQDRQRLPSSQARLPRPSLSGASIPNRWIFRYSVLKLMPSSPAASALLPRCLASAP